MKQISLIMMTFLLVLSHQLLMGQSPESFSYQAVLRDANNEILVNQNVGLRLSVLKTSTSGNIVYSETHSIATNAYGIVNLDVGQGTLVSGSFTNIQWGNDLYFLKVDLDMTGGQNYQFMGTSQLLSVPYALHAKTAANFNEIDGDSTNELQVLSLSNDTLYLSQSTYVVLPADQVNDNDADSTNELQVLSLSNDTLYLSQSTYVVLPADQVNDNDADSTNELQILSFQNDTLILSNGNQVYLGDIQNIWTKSGNLVYVLGDKIGIGTQNPTANLHIKDTTFNGGPNGLINLEGGSESSIMFQTDSVGVDQTKMFLDNASNQLQIRHGGSTFVYFHENGSMSVGASNASAKLVVEETNSSDTTTTLMAHTIGGYAVKGKSISTSNSHWMNAGIIGEVEQNGNTSGTGVRGIAYGNAGGMEAFGVRGEAGADSAVNQGVSGVALSNAANPNWHIGGKFEAHGDWDTSKGIGTGTHYGVRAEATATTDWACGVRGFGFTQSQSSNENYGARFTATGINYDPTNTGTGSHFGTYGEAFGSGERNYGVYGHAKGQGSTGRNFGGFFIAENATQTDDFVIGVVSKADSSTYVNRGIEAVTYSNVGQWNQGGFFKAGGIGHASLSTDNTGVYAIAENNRLENIAFEGEATGSNNTCLNFGARLVANGGGAWNTGIKADAKGTTNSGSNYGGEFLGTSEVQTNGYNYGIRAEADSSAYINRGVMAIASSNVGQHNHGGLFLSEGTGNPSLSTSNIGVYGVAENNRLNNYGALATGNAGSSGNTAWAYGVRGEADGSKLTNRGVQGTSYGGGEYNMGLASWAIGNCGADSSNYGLYANAYNADNNYGAYLSATGTGLSNYGIYAEVSNGATNNYAGFFDGNVTVTGNLNVTGSISKGSGTFKIDHPTDPENKYLVHSFVESPEMINVYSGNITTDANGLATITLPDYFSAVNKDFRYQLTCIGVFAQAIVKEEIIGNYFVVQTDKPNVKLSWQVSAIRNDKYANQHRVVAEQEKTDQERGKYLHPELFGKTVEERVYPKYKDKIKMENPNNNIKEGKSDIKHRGQVKYRESKGEISASTNNGETTSKTLNR